MAKANSPSMVQQEAWSGKINNAPAWPVLGFLARQTVKYLKCQVSAILVIRDPQVRRRLHSMEKWTGWDLNPRPLPCQDSDLPADLPARDALYPGPSIKVSLRVAAGSFSS